MQIHTRPRLDAVHAALDTLRLMLVRLAAALLDACADDGAIGRWLRRQVAAEFAVQLHEFKHQAVLLAFATRVGVPVTARRGGHRPSNGRPRYAPAGFRRSRGQGSGLRCLTRPLVRRLKRGGLSMRVEALSRALRQVEACLDELVARLEALAPFARLTPVAPGAGGLIFSEDFGAVAAPDFS